MRAEDDPRWDLIRQLIEYKKFKEAAAQLQALALEQERIFARAGPDWKERFSSPLPLGEVGIFQLINALQTVIKRVEAREDLREIFGEHFTVSEKIDTILRRVSGGAALKFSELFAEMAGRIEIVVTFSGFARVDSPQTGSGYADESVRRNRDRLRFELAKRAEAMPRILIAGCGYVGQAAADLLHERGWNVEGWTASAQSAGQLAAKPYAVRAVDLTDSAAGLSQSRGIRCRHAMREFRRRRGRRISADLPGRCAEPPAHLSNGETPFHQQHERLRPTGKVKLWMR